MVLYARYAYVCLGIGNLSEEWRKMGGKDEKTVKEGLKRHTIIESEKKTVSIYKDL